MRELLDDLDRWRRSRCGGARPRGRPRRLGPGLPGPRWRSTSGARSPARCRAVAWRARSSPKPLSPEDGTTASSSPSATATIRPLGRADLRRTHPRLPGTARLVSRARPRPSTSSSPPPSGPPVPSRSSPWSRGPPSSGAQAPGLGDARRDRRRRRRLAGRTAELDRRAAWEAGGALARGGTRLVHEGCEANALFVEALRAAAADGGVRGHRLHRRPR